MVPILRSLASNTTAAYKDIFSSFFKEHIARTRLLITRARGVRLHK